MTREDDIQPAGAARTLKGPTLKGLADELAVEVRNTAAAFLAKAAHTRDVGASDDARIADIDKTMRTIAAIARAGAAVQRLQAAEDQAEARAVSRCAEQAKARVHALNRIHHQPNHPEGDETDMHEPDPRLEDPKRMAAADKELVRRLDAFALEIKAESLPEKPARRPAPFRAGQLGDAEPQGPAPAH